jgi:hypothetical protein
MILYLKDPKILQKSPRFAKYFSNVAGYKINVQTSVAFLYTNNEQDKKEMRKTIPFIIVLKNT